MTMQHCHIRLLLLQSCHAGTCACLQDLCCAMLSYGRKCQSSAFKWSGCKERSSSTTGLLQPPVGTYIDASRLPPAGLQCHRMCAIGPGHSVGVYRPLAIHFRFGLMIWTPLLSAHSTSN